MSAAGVDRVARASVDVDVPPERLYALIVDFESYPTFVPNQSAARVLERPAPDRYVVAFELQVARTLHYTLELEGEPSRALRWRLVEGDMMRRMEGGWTLEPLPEGGTRATYEIVMDLEGFVPRTVYQALVDRTLPANVRAFKLEAERRG